MPADSPEPRKPPVTRTTTTTTTRTRAEPMSAPVSAACPGGPVRRRPAPPVPVPMLSRGRARLWMTNAPSLPAAAAGLAADRVGWDGSRPSSVPPPPGPARVTQVTLRRRSAPGPDHEPQQTHLRQPGQPQGARGPAGRQPGSCVPGSARGEPGADDTPGPGRGQRPAAFPLGLLPAPRRPPHPRQHPPFPPAGGHPVRDRHAGTLPRRRCPANRTALTRVPSAVVTGTPTWGNPVHWSRRIAPSGTATIGTRTPRSLMLPRSPCRGPWPSWKPVPMLASAARSSAAGSRWAAGSPGQRVHGPAPARAVPSRPGLSEPGSPGRERSGAVPGG